MESVYKLSKYSQKISEACRSKQLDKVMEYNQHELAHINKLSKYFGNQKGGAEVREVVEAVQELVQAVVADRNRVIGVLQQSVREKDSVIAQIDNEIEGRILDISEEGGEAQQALTPAVVLQKVQKLKEESDRLTRENETLQREKGEVQGTASRGSETLERIQTALNAKVQELDQAKAQLAKARTKTDDLQKSLNEVSSQATELSTQNEQLKARVKELEQELSRAKAETQTISEANATANAKIRELEEANAQFEAQAQQAQRYKDAATASDESVKRIQTEHKQALAQAQAQANAFKLQLDVVQGKVDQKNKDHLAVLEAKDARIAELEQAVADAQQMMTKSEEKLKASLRQLQPRKSS